MATLISSSFDTTTVDPSSVTLASASVRLKGKGDPVASVKDNNSDGLDDLLVQVDTNFLAQSTGSVEAILEAMTTKGSRFRYHKCCSVIPYCDLSAKEGKQK